MQQFLQKIKRVKPLIKVKKSRVDEEAAELIKIRNEKVAVVTAMKESQKRYMNGVEELNRIRASASRDNLTTLEGGLDYVKSQWYQLYRQVQELEQKEKAQTHQLIMAEQELKSVEKLQEKYEREFKYELKKSDQKIQDEIALRKFSSR